MSSENHSQRAVCLTIYLRYIQFRTLHRRFFTNNILHKMRIKDSPLCNFCAQKEDSNEHMLIECETVQTLWHQIEEWISSIGVMDYSITNSVIILGELQKSFWLYAIILITKKPSSMQELMIQCRCLKASKHR